MLITFIFSYLERFFLLFYCPLIFHSGETPARATPTPIFNCFTYLLWAYLLTVSEYSCLAMLAKPYP